MKIFMYAVLAIVAVTVAVVLVASRKSDTFSVTRTATLNAPVSAVFAQVNDFHKWNDWSPWAKMDPNAKNTFSGPSAGKDAHFAWEGNSSVGAGNMTITDSVPNERIVIRLEFLKPMAGVNTTIFMFKPEGDKTVVTWDMSGKNNLTAKIISLFMNCEKMVGGQFDQGLAAIGQAANKK